MRVTPKQAYELCRRFEGLRLKAYVCPAGILTIGFGSTKNVKSGMIISPTEAENRLSQDLSVSTAAAIRYCPTLLLETDGRLAAISDFVFNLGGGRLKISTLRKRINEKKWSEVAKELNKWVWGGGKKLPGLILRRRAEAALL
jgi:lysozyme